MSDDRKEALLIAGVSKTFPGGKALHNVSLTVRAGEVHALIGVNGSGKSTLVKCIAGVQSADTGGFISIGDASVDAGAITPRWSWQHGVRVVHQKPGIFPSMTVADNLGLGRNFPTRWGFIRNSRLNDRSQELLQHFGITASPKQKAGELSFADQTMVAIARALREVPTRDSSEVSVLILDEPTAALPKEEVETVLSAVRSAAQLGVGVIYVSHRLEEIMRLADWVTVLRDGRMVASVPTAEVSQESLIISMLGKQMTALETAVDHAIALGDTVIELEGLTGPQLSDISFQVHEGEVLGLAGLLGSGSTELLRALFGCHEITQGSITLDGRLVHPTSPSSAMSQGIFYVSAQRDTEAAFPDLTVRENLSAATIQQRQRWGMINAGREDIFATEQIAAFGIKTKGDGALMSSLSGGNQQRVVLARGLARKPRLVLLDEPTQGVDVGARVDTYLAIDRAARAGTAFVVASSDFKELAEICHRVLVLADGQVRATLPRAKLSEDFIAKTVLSVSEMRHVG